MRILLICCLLGALAPAEVLFGSDHADTPLLGMLGRQDARITDTYAFIRGQNLVLVLCTDPAIPPSVTDYQFAPDLAAAFHIDCQSRVTRDVPLDLIQFGGTIVRPNAVAENVTIRITFDDEGNPKLQTTGIAKKYQRNIRLFAGLRDDPFIRRPRSGRNSAAIVVEFPIEAVLRSQPDLLIWATTSVPEFDAPIADHSGRALRSMFVEAMNSLGPSDHWRVLQQVPDVMILDTGRDSGYPNGRELTDDVVDLMIDIPGGTLPGEEPDFPTENDLPFLPGFPYLAAPHPAPGEGASPLP
jgi:hypothetical protein